MLKTSARNLEKGDVFSRLRGTRKYIVDNNVLGFVYARTTDNSDKRFVISPHLQVKYEFDGAEFPVPRQNPQI